MKDPTLIVQDPRWAALTTPGAASYEPFFYGVITTGIYCKPSCSSRLPKPEHVQFFATTMSAEAAGFRPCKRCKPDQVGPDDLFEKITLACRLLEQSPVLGLAELAKSVNLSKDHFQRVFKRITGVTPKAYAQAYRAERLRNELAKGVAVTEAIYSAGFNTSSRFYEKSDDLLGMTASRYRRGGAQTTISFAVGQAALGAVLVAQSERGICAVLLGDDPNELAQDLQDRFPKAELVGGDSHFERLVAQVVGFVDSPHLGLGLPLDIRGTAFQQRVWQALCEIPPGATASYTDIANKIGAPKAVRAVAGACAANALAVVIPCHRVVRNDGALSGYRWGVERKRQLLGAEREQANRELQPGLEPGGN